MELIHHSQNIQEIQVIWDLEEGQADLYLQEELLRQDLVLQEPGDIHLALVEDILVCLAEDQCPEEDINI